MKTPITELSSQNVRSKPIQDSDEKLIDIKTAGFLKYGPPPESPETAPHYRLLREGVIAKLEAAQTRLPKGLSFRLYEGYRHPEFQHKLFLQQLARITATNPGWSGEQCYQQAAKLASPIKTFSGQKIVPPHSTGGALDIEIVDSSGQVIDFGMEIKDWFRVTPALCESDYPELAQAARENRNMLIDILQSEGFVNYPREWWHFSYGDQYWAFMKNSEYALYDRVELLKNIPTA